MGPPGMYPQHQKMPMSHQMAMGQQMQVMPQDNVPSELNGMDNYEQSCIFFGNIPYDADDNELRDTFKMAGPFSVFRLKIDSNTKQPKGFGFCLYSDPDVASSALRNLKKHEIMNRPLKVDFASDNKNGNNLKREDVLFRDTAEIVKTSQASQ